LTWAAFALVLGSAFLHALWNTLAKRARDSVGFLWCSQTIITMVCLPLAVGSLAIGGWSVPGVLVALGSGAVQAGYLILLGSAYDRADLSLVYPLVRAVAACVVAGLAVPLLGETVSGRGYWGVGLVTVGVFVLQAPWRLRRRESSPVTASSLALLGLLLVLTAFIAAYQLIDKVGVGLLNPLAYLCLASFAHQAGFTTWILGVGRGAQIRAEWSRSRRLVVAGGVLSLLSYLLLLWALTVAQVSYLAPMRNFSMVFAVVLGATVLRERLAWSRLPGVLILLAGVALLRWA
jgi:uncharacterized membrane protein